MMKTDVLTQETGSTAGLKTEPSSPPSPSLTPALSARATPLPLPRTPLSSGPPKMGPPTLLSKSPGLASDNLPLTSASPAASPSASPSAPPTDPTHSALHVHLDSFSLLPELLTDSSPPPDLLTTSELLSGQMDTATVANYFPEANASGNVPSPLITPHLSDISGTILVSPQPPQDSVTSTSLLTPVPPSVTSTSLLTPVPPSVTSTSPLTPVPPPATSTSLLTPVPSLVISTTPLTDILDVSAPPLPSEMSSPVPEVLSLESTLPEASSPPVLKSTPPSAPHGAPPVSIASTPPVSSPRMRPKAKSSLFTPNIPPAPKPISTNPLVPPVSKPSVSPPLIPPVPKALSPPLPSARVPPTSKPVQRPSAPRKPSGLPQSRPPVPHPHSVANHFSPALLRPPPPSARPATPSLPLPLVPLAPIPTPAPATALSPALSPALLPDPPPAPTSPAHSPAMSPSPVSPASISILEKLIKTCPVWLQLSMAQQKASLILKKEPPGIFLMRKSADQNAMVLSVRVSDQQGEPLVQDILVKEERSLMYLEGSVLVFDNIFKLIAFYCVSRDILPFTLRLPQVIVQATKYEDIEMMSLLGSDFWGSQLNNSSKVVDPGQNHSSTSCVIPPSGGTANDLLWYLNPIFIEEYFSSLETSGTVPLPIVRSQSLNTPGQMPQKFKRPPPRPPNVPEISLLSQGAKQGTSDSPSTRTPPPPLGATNVVQQKGEGNRSEEKGERAAVQKELSVTATSTVTAKQPPQPPPPTSAHGSTARSPPLRIPPVPLRRKPSEKCLSPPGQKLSHLEEDSPALATSSKSKTKPEEDAIVAVASLVCIGDTSVIAEEEKARVEASLRTPVTSETSNSREVVTVARAPQMKKAAAPVPPPRWKKSTQATGTSPHSPVVIGQGLLSINASLTESDLPNPQTSSAHLPPQRPILPVGVLKDTRGADTSLYSPEGGAALHPLEHDSYSTSSTEEEADTVTSIAGDYGGNHQSKVSMKRTSTIILDRAKHRLSMVNFSNVFTNLMSADCKLQKKIVELSRDGSSYFGNLMRDYRVYTLETMGKHTSSAALLQEIRQMMTQLKSYLIQSTELQNLLEPNIYTEDKLEVIIEAALCKAVLKPLREAVYSGLKDIHAKNGCLKRLKENQSVVLGTTTTDLGVTTSIPEAPVMEKIQHKLMTLHQQYSPQKKIDLLLKTCKIIYESMSVGCPGRAHGADDFLPVLMYVLARCNMANLLLDVEYMMELMDSALQLGEGSYYLTTTYGVLEHIKNYDKPAVTRQLSLEIQDSIHRWERRRTTNKGRVSRSSLQDFINVSFLEAGLNTKTLGVHPSTTARDLCAQCADKFEVPEPESYSLCVLVEGHYQPVAPEEFPLTIKSTLHHSEPRKEYHFVYRPGRTESEGQEAEVEIQQPTEPTAPEPEVEESLIEI